MSSHPALPPRATAREEGGAAGATAPARDGASGLGRTRRERLRDLLLSTEDGLTLEQIEKILEVKRQTAVRDLEHLRLSLRHKAETLMMIPPACTSCGFVFRLEAPKAPSRCPMCKSRDLSEPVFKAAADA